MKNRIGKIKVSETVLYEYDLMKVLYSKVIPLEIKHINYTPGTFEVIGYSPEFSEWKEGDPIPEYEVLFTRMENGENEISKITRL